MIIFYFQTNIGGEGEGGVESQENLAQESKTSVDVPEENEGEQAKKDETEGKIVIIFAGVSSVFTIIINYSGFEDSIIG